MKALLLKDTTQTPVLTLDLSDYPNQNKVSPDGNPVVVDYPPANITGGVLPYVVEFSKATGSLFPVGTTTVNVTVTSADGQTDVESFDVIVTYESAPPTPPTTLVINQPVNVSKSSPDGNPVAVTWSNPGAVGGTQPYTYGYTVGGVAKVSGASFAVGTHTVVATVTDSTTPTAQTSTKNFTITVFTAGPVDPGDAHAYFNMLVARPDFLKGYSFRPKAGHAATSVHYEKQLLRPVEGGLSHSNSIPTQFSYDPENDPNPARQDAAKFIIPAWNPYGTLTLAADIDADDTVINLNVAASIPASSFFKIGDEVLKTPAVSQGTTSIVNVIRGQFSTVAAPHVTGDKVLRVTNSLLNQLRVPLGLGGPAVTGQKYLITWDALWADSWKFSNHGIGEMKFFQFATLSGTISYEPQTVFTGGYGTIPAPTGWDQNNDVCTFSSRLYLQHVSTPFTRKQPLAPHLNESVIARPGEWVRFWVYVEINSGTDGMYPATTLSSPVAPGDTVVNVHHTIRDNPFYMSGAGRTYRTIIKINNEYMRVDSAPIYNDTDAARTPRPLTVSRGQFGSTPASHAAGDTVSIGCDFITIYVAGESQAARQLHARAPVLFYTNPTEASNDNRLHNWWVEANTSDDAFHGRVTDMEAYVRNFVVLANPSESDFPELMSYLPTQ